MMYLKARGSDFDDCLRSMTGRPEIALMGRFTQHGDTSCLLHSIAVARASFTLGRALRLNLRERDLARGALLHDYFLYDWHTSGEKGMPHAFFHPYIALRNARRDFTLSPVEENIILSHMFPLLPIPPRYKESWLVTLVDKCLSVYETFNRNTYRTLRSEYICRNINREAAL